jgi:cyclic pyranopterin phosphate synthase
MPREKFSEDFEFLRREMLLSFEEINRCVAALLPLGVEKVRITGGEPLLRRDLANLVAMLSAHGIDMALTTNGALLSKYALVLSKAGLNRVTVSLDALDDETFRGMNDMNDEKMSLQQILNGIESATDAGLEVKINCVVRAGVNEHVILQLVEYFRHTPHVLRFIEFMDVGMTNEWRWDEVVTSERILSIIGEVYPLNPIKRSYPGEVAERYLFADGGGEIGIISSVSKPFCGDCSRARISADGKIYTCLFAAEGHDLREVIRGGASDEEVREFVRNIWHHRDDRYSELRSATTTTAEKIEMSYIGG